MQLFKWWQALGKPKTLQYATFNAKPGVEQTLVVDCLHPTCPTLTHHKGGKTPLELRDDTSGRI